MTDLPPISLRPFNPDDREELNLVRKSWLVGSLASDFARLCGHTVFVRDHLPWRDRILARATVLVACLKREPTAVLAWACSETQDDALVLHFVHVKPRWRRLGLARKLLAPLLAERVAYSHRTTLCGALPIPAAWTFRPHAAFWTPDSSIPAPKGQTNADDVRLHHVSSDSP